MDILLPVNELKYATSLLSTIANTRSAYNQPYIQISVDQSGVSFFATSYEISAKYNFLIPEIHSDGQVLVSAPSLNGFVSRLYDKEDGKAMTDPVRISRTSGDKITLKTQTRYKQGDTVKHNLRLEEKSPEAFSSAFKIDTNLFAEIDGMFLKEALEKTGYAMSTDDTTAPVFRGVNFKSDGNSFKITSTDGKELARYERPLKLPIFDSVISSTVVSNLAKNVNPTIPAYFYFQDGKIFVRTGNLYIMGSTIAEDYPNVDHILNAEDYNHFLVSKMVIHDSIMNIMPNVDTKSNRINLSIKNNELTIKGMYTNETTNVGIKVYDFADEFEFDCNGWYLQHAVSKIESDMVKVLFRGSEEPVIVKDDADQPFDMTTLLVPMRKF